MAADKLDVARRVVEAYNRRDVDALFADLATPDFQYWTAITAALDDHAEGLRVAGLSE